MTGSGVRPLDLPCGEQSKRPTAKASSLRKGTSNMSEQEKPKSSFMQELDQWTDEAVIDPIVRAAESDEFRMQAEAHDEVRASIRAKVLESYRNGQAAGPRPAAKSGWKGGR